MRTIERSPEHREIRSAILKICERFRIDAAA